MSAVSSVCVVGGGFAGRALIKRLMHDSSLTVVSRGLYHLSNQRLVDNALGYELTEEISLRRHSDIYELVEQSAVQLSKNSDGRFDVRTADGQLRSFDHLVLASGYRLDPRFASLAQEVKSDVYSTFNQLQALRLRASWDKIRQGKVVIATAGSSSKCVFNAVSLALFLTEPNFFYFGSQQKPKSVDLHISDNLLLPSEPLESLKLTNLLRERGIKVHLSESLHSIDRENHTAVFVAQQATGPKEETVSFDSLIVDPKIEADALLQEPVDPATLMTKTGVFVAGHLLRDHFKLMSEESIEAQADHIANRLLGRSQSSYEHTSRFRLYNSCTRSHILKFDAQDKLLYHSLELHHSLHHKLQHSLDSLVGYVWSPSRSQL